MVPVNDRFWPKAAVALKSSRMSELGQRRDADVRLGSLADINRTRRLCPLSGVKRTSKGHCRDFAV